MNLIDAIYLAILISISVFICIILGYFLYSYFNKKNIHTTKDKKKENY